MGGTARLNSMFEDLKAAARRTLTSMASIDEALDREERTDEEFRLLNPHWPGTPSKVLNTDVRNNNKRMREAYRNAQTSDKEIEQEMGSETTAENLKTVSKTREELLKLFPKAPTNLLDYDEALDKKVENPDIAKLEDRLHELAALIEARESSVAALRKIVSVDITDIAAAALSSGAQDITAVHNKNLAEASELQDAVVRGISQQDALLHQILTLNDAFVKDRLTNALAIERNKVIQLVEQSVAKFSLIHSQITAGTTFYSSLQVSLTVVVDVAERMT